MYENSTVVISEDDMDYSSRSASGKHADLSACIVWTPIPLLTWLLPFFGHIGIVTSTGVIRDFAGPYHVATDDMAFGEPTKYIVMDLGKVEGGAHAWDAAIQHASDEYKRRMHNLFCDNCHHYVSLALNKMKYGGCSSGWGMWRLTALMFVTGRYVGVGGFAKTWLPTLIIAACIIGFASL